MKIDIKDEKRLKELAKEFNLSPAKFLNNIVDGLSFPPGFKDEARKSSLKTAVHRALWGSYYARKLEEEVYAILGKHDYHIDDGEIDLEKRTCWFNMYFSSDEKLIDLDSIHFQLNEGSSALVAAQRTIDEISSWDKIEEAQSAVTEAAGDHFSDSRDLDIEFHEIDENSIAIEITIEDEDVVYLPKLKEINKAMDEIEYKFRKVLSS